MRGYRKNPGLRFVPIANSQCWEMGQVLVLKLMSPEFNIFIADLISNRGHATFQHFNISIF